MSKYLIVCAILSCILDCKQSEVSRETIIRMDLKKMHQMEINILFSVKIRFWGLMCKPVLRRCLFQDNGEKIEHFSIFGILGSRGRLFVCMM